LASIVLPTATQTMSFSLDVLSKDTRTLKGYVEGAKTEIGE